MPCILPLGRSRAITIVRSSARYGWLFHSSQFWKLLSRELAPDCLVTGLGARVLNKSAVLTHRGATTTAESVVIFSSYARNEPRVEPSIMSTLPFWYLVSADLPQRQ
jgi:hypothetical protein